MKYKFIRSFWQGYAFTMAYPFNKPSLIRAKANGQVREFERTPGWLIFALFFVIGFATPDVLRWLFK